MSEVDSGNLFNLEIGQEIVERLADRSTPVEAYTTNPAVLKQVSKPRKDFVNRPLMTTGFIAVGTGSARIGMVYQRCQESLQPACRFEFLVSVVRFPKTNVAIYTGSTSTVTLRLGQSARFSAPTDRYDRWKVTIDNPNVLRLSVQPIVLPSYLTGVVTTTGVGTAELHATLEAGPQPWWGNAWGETITVVN